MSRSRSRSPSQAERSEKPKKKSGGGFRWKEKSATTTEEPAPPSLERGYRTRSPPRKLVDKPVNFVSSHEDDIKSTKQRTALVAQAAKQSEARSIVAELGPTDVAPAAAIDASVDSKFGAGTSARLAKSTSKTTDAAVTAAAQTLAAAPSTIAQVPVQGQEAMIIVHVNDRLGTKAAVPALPSDKIERFKRRVAAQIGRKPHELLLKRQGHKPFNDRLTLADYEIHNGVQIDLEVDTGE